MSNPISAILGWLRAGYPDGVPPKDVFPLLALLERTLSEEEVSAIVERLIEENPRGDIEPDAVRAAIARRKDAPVTAADVRDVASRLAAAGWPLSELPGDVPRAGAAAAEPERAGADGTPAEVSDTGPIPDAAAAGTTIAATDDRTIVQRIIDWLAVGYPQGVPPTDRVPLIALLRRAMTEEEAEQIASHLVARAGEGDEHIAQSDAAAVIARYTDQAPTQQDLERVAARLAAKGWPLRG